MSDFKILDETTTVFKCSNVCVMLLCHNGEFGVEVVDRKESFGRVFLKDRDEKFIFIEVINAKKKLISMMSYIIRRNLNKI